MTVPQKITEELQSIEPSSIIELFELQLVAALHGSADIYRFHAGVNGKNDGGNVIWAGQTYTAFPVECEGFEYSGNGQLPRPKLRVANLLGTITTILLAVNAITPGNDLIGAKVVRRRTLARYIDAVNFPGNVNPYGTPDSTAEFPQEIYYVSRKVVENRDVVEFELSSAFDLQGVRAPKRQCIANICQWQYRSAECGYTGTRYFNENDTLVVNAADDVCGKRLNSCAIRFGYAANLSTAGFSDRRTSGQSLTTNQELRSPNGWYRLVMQADGNLCLYDKGGKFRWGTGTSGSGAVRMTMQTDGNLVLYTAANAPVWSLEDEITIVSGSYVVLQDNGNLVLRNPSNVGLWFSSSSDIREPTSPATLPFGSFPGVGSYTL